MNYNNYLKQYQLSNVLTASPVMLIVMLYDEAIKMCNMAKIGFNDKNRETVHNALIKVQKIITELTVALDTNNGGEVAENLKSLYIYLHRRLVEANVEYSIEKVEESLKILISLREAWQQVTVEARKQMLEQRNISLEK